MEHKALDVILEVEKKSPSLAGAMFYRYGMGDYQFWFSQDMETGNIYSLSLRERDNAAFGLQKSQNAAEKGAFSHAVGAENAEQLAIVGLEAEIFQNRTAVIAEAEVTYFKTQCLSPSLVIR